ncbi:hypothetical protein [Ectothiorhodospira lacustris]|uniref:hypothetical protein n=1 Tax=Ectothiorhodospira lacustris TaxID=2899127 RepID=UPI001EE8D2F5|nr:hypothetical protein [Ectothiorhodospira lacustris]MCG5510648.1 hypothetical protein [Ectothiorhodospira lacustris]MCG5522452.1 hypothetical protein [Ectothiorhodospira lacustris]
MILHIGTEKTGSTALQGALYRHRDLLRSYGLAYYHSPGRQEARGIASAALDNKAADDYLRQLGCEDAASREAFRQCEVDSLRNTLESLPPSVHTVILSSEHFHSRLVDTSHLTWLRQLLEPFAESFEVVVYLRRQVDMLASFYSTQLKNGGTQLLERTAERACHSRNHYYNYKKLLALWGKVFGHDALCVRLFTPAFLQGRTIQEDFLSLVQCPQEAIQSMSISERHNESLIPAGQVMLRGLNVRIADLPLDAVHERGTVEVLRNDLVRDYKGVGMQLTASQALRIQAGFDESNEWVRQAWFSQRECLFEPLESDYGERRGPLMEISKAQLTLAEGVVGYLGDVAGAGQPLSELEPCASWFRDLALQLEDSKPDVALRLMALAHRIRPQEEFIADRLDSYRDKVSTYPSSGMNALWQRLRDLWTSK